MSRSRSLALLTAAALTAALAPAALASAAVPVSADKVDRAKAEHERIVAYWTPERMKAAKPRDFVRQKDGSFELAPTPVAEPIGTTSSPITGASWVTEDGTGGDVKNRTGKVYFTLGTRGYVCSGAVALEAGTTTNAVILTAGHCVYDQAKYTAKRPNAGFASNWLFIPDFDSYPNLNTSSCSSATTAYGCWTAKALVVHKGFASQRSFTAAATTYDFAFAVVGEGGISGDQDLETVVGPGYGIDTDPFDGPFLGDVLSAFGYPAAKPYKGSDLTYCSGKITPDANNGGKTWGMACNMTGGSSGGPWLTTGTGDTELNLATGDGGTLASLNSYGYSGIANMYGPKFNGYTATLYAEAKAKAAGALPLESRVVG